MGNNSQSLAFSMEVFWLVSKFNFLKYWNKLRVTRPAWCSHQWDISSGHEARSSSRWTWNSAQRKTRCVFQHRRYIRGEMKGLVLSDADQRPDWADDATVWPRKSLIRFQITQNRSVLSLSREISWEVGIDSRGPRDGVSLVVRLNDGV